jgi:hypothetical protein
MIFNTYFDHHRHWAGRRGGFRGGPFARPPGGFSDWFGDFFGPPPARARPRGRAGCAQGLRDHRRGEA